MVGVDVILDSIGAAYFKKNLDSLNYDGRLFIIGVMSGAVSEIDLRALLSKRLTVQGIIILIWFHYTRNFKIGGFGFSQQNCSFSLSYFFSCFSPKYHRL